MTTPAGVDPKREAPSQTFEPYMHTLGVAPVQIVGADARRRSCLVSNTHPTATAYVVTKRSGSTADNAWPLVPGESVTLYTAAPIYAQVRAPDTIGSVKAMAELGSVC